MVTARSALREKHTKDLEAAEGALKDAKADRKESERDRRLAAAVDQLKRNIVGEVHYSRIQGRMGVLMYSSPNVDTACRTLSKFICADRQQAHACCTPNKHKTQDAMQGVPYLKLHAIMT